MRKIKYLLIVVLALALVGCKKGPKPEPEVDWDSKTIFNVEEVKECYEDVSYEYDEFKLSDLKIKIIYTDNTEREIPVTEDMLDEKDLAKLKKAGSPRVLITYITKDGEEYGFTYVVKLVDSSLLDENLNKDGKYNAVVKAIRNAETGVINFYLEPKDNVVALQFSYKFDNSIMQLSEGKLNESLKGKGNVKVENGKVSFAYSEDNSEISSETLLFSVKYTGDFRNSKLCIDEAFDNAVYKVDLDTNMTSVLENVLYHTSVK